MRASRTLSRGSPGSLLLVPYRPLVILKNANGFRFGPAQPLPGVSWSLVTAFRSMDPATPTPQAPTVAQSQTTALQPPKKSYVIKTHRELDMADMSSEEEEREEDYRKGGYHPVEIGVVFKDRYEVKSKLGWGHFSTVWLAIDHENNDSTVAIKIVKSARHYVEAANDEIKILKTATENDPHNKSCVIHLLDHFLVTGPNGTHVSMVFEKLGCNLLTLIRMYKYRGLPFPLVKILTKQMIIGMEFLHKCHIIHTDLKPENVLLVKAPKVIRTMPQNEQNKLLALERGAFKDDDDPRKGLPWSTQSLINTFGDGTYAIKIADLGNACWTHEHFTDDVQTRQYRAPEGVLRAFTSVLTDSVIIGAPYNNNIDVWSVACIVFELLTGDLLFEPKAGRSFDKNDGTSCTTRPSDPSDHLAQICELFGKMPKSLALSGKHSPLFFTPDGELKAIKNLKIWYLKDVLREKYKFSTTESNQVSDFLSPMLKVDPLERASAKQCLEHQWLQNIDVNDFNSCLEDWNE